MGFKVLLLQWRGKASTGNKFQSLDDLHIEKTYEVWYSVLMYTGSEWMWAVYLWNLERTWVLEVSSLELKQFKYLYRTYVYRCTKYRNTPNNVKGSLNKLENVQFRGKSLLQYLIVNLSERAWLKIRDIENTNWKANTFASKETREKYVWSTLHHLGKSEGIKIIGICKKYFPI